jgi:lipopolysaccharide biosynthesis glycosyltransferase
MSDRGPISIVAACDDAFAELVTVMLLSAFDRCRTTEISAYLIVSEAFSEQAQIVESLGAHADRVTFCRLNLSDLLGLKVRAALPTSAYFRLLLSELLPGDLEWVLYLDCDMVVRGDLAPLWETELEGCCVGAVEDPFAASQHLLELAEPARYFNSGMMLIDMRRWRTENVGARALEFARANPERLLWADQCALNAVLHRHWHPIEPKWNLMTPRLGQLIDEKWHFNRDAARIGDKAVILHFAGVTKPSFYMCEHPMRHEYVAYRKQTVWGRSPPRDYYPHNVIIKFLRGHAPILLPLYLQLRRYI